MSVERSCNPISVLDAQRRYVDVNAPLANAVGHSRAELIGTLADERFPEIGQARIDEGWRELIRTGERSSEHEVPGADGGRLLVRYTLRWHGEREIAVCVWESVDPPRSGIRWGLTPREREIIAMVARGMTSRDIAADLHVSLETVRTHIRNAMTKTDTHTRAGLVAKALGKR